MLKFKFNRYFLFFNKNPLSTSVTRVLGIECTCDDTSVAVVSSSKKIIAESHRNQWTIHKNSGFPPKNDSRCVGGIIPSLAARLHSENLLDCVSDCIENIDNGWDSIDGIALSIKPGLDLSRDFQK